MRHLSSNSRTKISVLPKDLGYTGTRAFIFREQGILSNSIQGAREFLIRLIKGNTKLLSIVISSTMNEGSNCVTSVHSLLYQVCLHS